MYWSTLVNSRQLVRHQALQIANVVPLRAAHLPRGRSQRTSHDNPLQWPPLLWVRCCRRRAPRPAPGNLCIFGRPSLFPIFIHFLCDFTETSQVPQCLSQQALLLRCVIVKLHWKVRETHLAGLRWCMLDTMRGCVWKWGIAVSLIDSRLIRENDDRHKWISGYPSFRQTLANYTINLNV